MSAASWWSGCRGSRDENCAGLREYCLGRPLHAVSGVGGSGRRGTPARMRSAQMLPNCSASFGVDGPASRPTVRCGQPSGSLPLPPAPVARPGGGCRPPVRRCASTMTRAPMIAFHGTSGIEARTSSASLEAASPIWPTTASALYRSTGSSSKRALPRRTISSPTLIAARMSSRSLSTERRRIGSDRDGIREDISVLRSQGGCFDEVHAHAQNLLKLHE